MFEYNLPYELHRIRDKSYPKLQAKNIILGLTSPITKEDEFIKAISDTLVYLNDNKMSLFSKKIITNAYYLLSGRKLSNHKAINIVERYYEYFDCGFEEKCIEVIWSVLNNVHNYKLEFALLLMNYLFEKEGRGTISISKRMGYFLPRMLKNKSNVASLILDIENDIKSISDVNSFSIKEITDYFKTNRDEICTRFPIKRLYIFGSFVDGTKNEYSDLDLLVIFDDRITGNEALSLRNSLAVFLANKFNIHVDIIIFKYAIEYMDIMSLNKILTIY